MRRVPVDEEVAVRAVGVEAAHSSGPASATFRQVLAYEGQEVFRIIGARRPVRRICRRRIAARVPRDLDLGPPDPDDKLPGTHRRSLLPHQSISTARARETGPGSKDPTSAGVTQP